MDRKSLIILILSFALLMLWYPMLNTIYPPKALPRTNSLVSATNQLGTNIVAATNEPTQTTTNIAAAVTPTTAGPEETLVLSNNLLRLTFTSHGGGIKVAELQKYPETIECGGKATNKVERLASLNTGAPTPVLALKGGAALEGDGYYKLSVTNNVVQAVKQLPSGLVVTKRFELASNYLVKSAIRLENRGAEPLALPEQQWVTGVATPLSADDNLQNMGVIWFDGGDDTHVGMSHFHPSFLGCVPRAPRSEYSGGATNVRWAAVHNQFFTLATIPSKPASQIVVHEVALPRPTQEQIAAGAKTNVTGLEAALVFPGLTLAANGAWEEQLHLYAGPREFRTLEKIGAQFNNELARVMNFGFFGFFAKILLLSMNGLQQLLHVGYGWVIIIIAVIIKLLFWPLTQASANSAKRMQALQPQVKALQEKFKDDPAKMQRKMLELWRENKINPMSGCLPMLVQLPVFFGFYTMIQSAIELRGAQFLWACDLSKPDTLFMIPGLNFPFNPLPLLMGVTMLWQARITPMSPGMDPVQQKIMKYMPLMFLVILYNFSAGLTLYWTVQNLLTIAQMKLTSGKNPPAAPAPAPAGKAPSPNGPRPKKKRP